MLCMKLQIFNNLKLQKKHLIFFLLLLVLIVIVPIIQSLVFSQSYQKNGTIEVNEEIVAPFLKDFKKDNIILFFGYVGCIEVCTPLLHQLKMMYEKPDFNNLRSSTDIVFVNLLTDVTPDSVKQFTNSFNVNFKGIYLSSRELNKMERNFRLFFSKNLFNKAKMNHTDYIYLIKRQTNGQFLLKNIYNTHPFKSAELKMDLLER